jgi:hypothetical protein
MVYLNKKESYKLLHRLKERVKELSETPMFEGGYLNIQRINLDDLVVELALKYCDTDKVLVRIRELREMRSYAPRKV